MTALCILFITKWYAQTMARLNYILDSIYSFKDTIRLDRRILLIVLFRFLQYQHTHVISPTILYYDLPGEGGVWRTRIRR
jgi:hypothetical protein